MKKQTDTTEYIYDDCHYFQSCIALFALPPVMKSVVSFIFPLIKFILFFCLFFEISFVVDEFADGF
jgi:hypothetical protein